MWVRMIVIQVLTNDTGESDCQMSDTGENDCHMSNTCENDCYTGINE